MPWSLASIKPSMTTVIVAPMTRAMYALVSLK